MTAFAKKIRDSFSDFWLNLELFFARLIPHKKKKSVGQFKPAKETQQDQQPVEPQQNSLDQKPEVGHEKVIGQVVKEEKKRDIKIPFSLKLLRFSKKERLFFFDQMSTLVNSGVTLIDALSLVKHQTQSKGLKKLFGEMIHHVNTGLSLADTMELFPHLFPSMQTALIEAGEESGNLDLVLEEIVAEMETQQDFYHKITGAMFYPVVLIVLALGLVVGMMTFVIPKISKMYAQSDVALPGMTQFVIDASHFITNQWVILVGSIVGGIFLIWSLVKYTRFGRLLWEKFVRLIPYFGKIGQEKNIMMIASNMGMLLNSGVLIAEAFEITEKTIGNLHYKRGLKNIREGIILGKDVSEMMGLKDIKKGQFEKNKLFPLQVAQLIHIGETTGKIDKMLFKIRDNYHKSIDYKLKNISTMIEPIMIFIVAALVGSILLAVMLPFFYIGTTIG